MSRSTVGGVAFWGVWSWVVGVSEIDQSYQRCGDGKEREGKVKMDQVQPVKSEEARTDKLTQNRMCNMILYSVACAGNGSLKMQVSEKNII